MVNFVSKDFGDVNAREGLPFHSPSGHIQEWASVVLKQFLPKSAFSRCIMGPADFFPLHGGGSFKAVTAAGRRQSLEVCWIVLDLPAEVAHVNQKGVIREWAIN